MGWPFNAISFGAENNSHGVNREHESHVLISRLYCKQHTDLFKGGPPVATVCS